MSQIISDGGSNVEIHASEIFLKTCSPLIVFVHGMNFAYRVRPHTMTRIYVNPLYSSMDTKSMYRRVFDTCGMGSALIIPRSSVELILVKVQI